jgi:hypothetical protein
MPGMGAVNLESRALRRASPILAIPLAAAVMGLGASAAAASSGNAVNYGQCVATGTVDPSTSIFGPSSGFGSDPNTPTFSNGVINAIIQSDGSSHFTGSMTAKAQKLGGTMLAEHVSSALLWAKRDSAERWTCPGEQEQPRSEERGRLLHKQRVAGAAAKRGGLAAAPVQQRTSASRDLDDRFDGPSATSVDERNGDRRNALTVGSLVLLSVCSWPGATMV